MTMIDIVTREIKVVSEANRREHWARKARRVKQQRTMAAWLVRGFWHLDKSKKPKPPLSIVLTRFGSRNLDSDNLSGAFKAVRDGIADALGIDDGNAGLNWYYKQARDKQKGIRIQIAPLGSLCDQISRANPGDIIVIVPEHNELSPAPAETPARLPLARARRQGRRLRPEGAK